MTADPERISIGMEAGDGIGLRLSRLQGQNTTFYRVIKTTRRVSKTTPNPQSGVRFGVRSMWRLFQRRGMNIVPPASVMVRPQTIDPYKSGFLYEAKRWSAREGNNTSCLWFGSLLNRWCKAHNSSSKIPHPSSESRSLARSKRPDSFLFSKARITLSGLGIWSQCES